MKTSVQLPPVFWKDHVSRNLGRHNLSSELWDRICKIRNRPIIVTNDSIFGNPSRPHLVVPKDCLGYAIDFPEEFFLSEEELESIRDCPPDSTPILLLGHDGIVFLKEGSSFRVTEPFFDMSLADLADMEVNNART